MHADPAFPKQRGVVGFYDSRSVAVSGDFKPNTSGNLVAIQRGRWEWANPPAAQDVIAPRFGAPFDCRRWLVRNTRR